MGEMTDRSKLLLRILPWAIALPYVANVSGWLLTEVGRFPWVVYGLVKLEAGVSTRVTVLEGWISLIGYVLVYTLLIIPTVYLFFKVARTGMPAKAPEKVSEAASSLVGFPH
jgi:cytochrome d ubiquinol oxidase subunit I